MKKLILFAAMAATVLTACGKNEIFEKEIAQTPISFGAYAGKAATKATYGDITTANIKTSTDGFAVFAYYTKENDWATAGATAQPNFMYEQQVTWKDDMTTAEQQKYVTKWYYTPLKYWPNGQNSTAVNNETHTDKISFFAYAPYTESKGSEGVTAVSANNATGAPTVSFTVPAKAEEQVDLLYASAKDKTKQNINNEPSHTNDKVDLTFNHALSKLDVKVVAVVDGMDVPTTNLNTTDTKILLQELVLTINDSKSGTLNLETGNWTTPSGNSIVTYNNSSFAAGDKVTITPTTAANAQTGFDVTETAKVLVAGKSPLIIPHTATAGSITIKATYWVCTADDNLYEKYSMVEQVITTSNIDSFEFVKGAKHDITVKLGLTSVSFDVTVTDWTDGADADYWLPKNTTNS